MLYVRTRRIPGYRALRGNRRIYRAYVRFHRRHPSVVAVSGKREETDGSQNGQNRDHDDELRERETR